VRLNNPPPLVCVEAVDLVALSTYYSRALSFLLPSAYQYLSSLCAGEDVVLRHGERKDRLVVLHAMRQRRRTAVPHCTVRDAAIAVAVAA
jgi:hypothetical protein